MHEWIWENAKDESFKVSTRRDAINIALNEGQHLGDNGQLCTFTGAHTGRAAKDKYIVYNEYLADRVNYHGDAGKPIAPNVFGDLQALVSGYLCNRVVYVHDFISSGKYIRLVTDKPSHVLFVMNMFEASTLRHDGADLTIIAVPGCKAPKNFRLNSSTFIGMDVDNGLVLIGGTHYAGEVKKSVFSYLSYILPDNGTLPMHSSVTTDPEDGSSAVFFGLSGTGKTTLSSDPSRCLIGDDEHGWNDQGLYNFEAGCYAKVHNLDKEGEPVIWNASNFFGTLLENVYYGEDGNVDFNYKGLNIENSRSAYPLSRVPNAEKPGTVAKHPENIIMLTCDAYGVLPSVAKLSPEAAAYHFVSGYTAKVAGTEKGVTEPQAVFSAFFGSPFMPRKTQTYVDLFLKKIEKHKPNIWLVNTGWAGGGPGVGKRMDLSLTRNIVANIINGTLADSEYYHNDTFNLDVPIGVANPETLWKGNGSDFKEAAEELKKKFSENIDKFDLPENVLKAGMPRGK